MRVLVDLYCSMCGCSFRYGMAPYESMYTQKFGYVCSKKCYDIAEIKYVRMILRRDEIV